VPDDSVVLNLNPFFLLADDPTPARSEQVLRAASLVYSSLKFVSALQLGLCEPDVWRGTPLCMAQFAQMFGTARIPHADRDEVKVSQSPTHVVVLCRNQFYFFDALWPTGELGITEEDLEYNIRSILSDGLSDDGNASAQDPPVGLLTTESRKRWAVHRQQLEALSENNRAITEIIDSACFIVCLDTANTHHSLAQACGNMLHGTYQVREQDGKMVQIGSCCNRWYDKHQIIITADGTAGINFEHSATDGHTILRFVSDVFADTVVRFAQSITSTTHGKDYLQPILPTTYKKPSSEDEGERQGPRAGVRKMSWDVNEDLKQTIAYAETAISDQIVQNEVVTLEFAAYGAEWIKHNRCSPDSFIQIAMQAAYYTLYGEFAPTYEAVMTKPFLHGRTEAGRSCTSEYVDFAKIFISAASAQEKHAAFQVALKAHGAMLKQCASGKGIDRHFFALRAMAKMHGIAAPAFFGTDAWNHLNTTLLSTSNCGNPSLRMFGFGPVSPQGFGLGYIIKPDGIAFCVSSKHRQTLRYVKTLEQTLYSLKTMCNAITPDKALLVSAMSDPGMVVQAEPEPEPAPADGEGEYGDYFGLEGTKWALARQRTLTRTGSDLKVSRPADGQPSPRDTMRSSSVASSTAAATSATSAAGEGPVTVVRTTAGPPALP
jgi:carnitine O-acetyltransferase